MIATGYYSDSYAAQKDSEAYVQEEDDDDEEEELQIINPEGLDAVR
jgi:hypothetical protein